MSRCLTLWPVLWMLLAAAPAASGQVADSPFDFRFHLGYGLAGPVLREGGVVVAGPFGERAGLRDEVRPGSAAQDLLDRYARQQPFSTIMGWGGTVLLAAGGVGTVAVIYSGFDSAPATPGFELMVGASLAGFLAGAISAPIGALGAETGSRLLADAAEAANREQFEDAVASRPDAADLLRRYDSELIHVRYDSLAGFAAGTGSTRANISFGLPPAIRARLEEDPRTAARVGNLSSLLVVNDILQALQLAAPVMAVVGATVLPVDTPADLSLHNSVILGTVLTGLAATLVRSVTHPLAQDALLSEIAAWNEDTVAGILAEGPAR